MIFISYYQSLHLLVAKFYLPRQKSERLIQFLRFLLEYTSYDETTTTTTDTFRKRHVAL